MARQTGYLVIADISGYTAFLTQSELDHAEEILNSLIHTLLDNMKDPFVVSKLEGDAIFAYIPDGGVWQGQTLLEATENIYFAFARSIQQMTVNTTCTCTACSLIPTLDLKFVLHHGEYILSRIGGRQELSGPDVIAVHRLLKSEITDATKVKAYAFFSESCVNKMDLGHIAEAMIPHAEQYEHIGEVNGVVHDLHVVWEEEKERRQVQITEDEAWIYHTFDLSVPPSLAWEYLTDPDCTRQWIQASEYKNMGGGTNGRMGTGSVQHCVHGENNELLVFTIEDWRPFTYFTNRAALPLDGSLLTTYQFEPTATGTRIHLMSAKPSAPNPLKNFALNLMVNLLMKKTLQKNYEFGGRTIQNMIAEDLKSGKISLSPSVADVVPVS